eukprot:TRINITY_DN5545_c0_g5_i1.p1 TRINITY_DN5545_c0_g5~~TRINITY_DN5545_c0_g5_i1.p1  ORF type:complete len:1034 (+),score=64.37 TRINITY_DN5545_c0_g5_i1:126-3227(+)
MPPRIQQRLNTCHHCKIPNGSMDEVEARVERVDVDGLRISWKKHERERSRLVPWSSLGLARNPETSRGHASLSFKLNCVDCNHASSWRTKTSDLQVRGGKGQLPEPRMVRLHSGTMHVDFKITEGARLQCLCNELTIRVLQLCSPLSVCLGHRDTSERGVTSLCGKRLTRQASTESRRRGKPMRIDCTDSYASMWGNLVQMEAAVAAIECQDSRLLYNVDVRWEAITTERGKSFRGHFDVPFHFAKMHSLKFRGLIRGGGETASGWLCITCHNKSNPSRASYSMHAHVIGASVPGHGGDTQRLVVDDDDVGFDMHRKHGVGGLINVTFEVLEDDVNRSMVWPPGKGDVATIEYLPKAISHQVMHIALEDINQSSVDDMSGQPGSLARDVALNVFEPATTMCRDDLARWRLNQSQEAAVRQCLTQRVHLVHGPAGTGKTRTASVLMGTFAEKNASRRRIVLFCAATNRAVDSALLCMNQLCEGARLLRIYSADQERSDFPVPRRGNPAEKSVSHAASIEADLQKFALHHRCHAACSDEPSQDAINTRSAFKRMCSMGAKDPDFDNIRIEYLKHYNLARASEVRNADVMFTTCTSVRRNAILEALWKDDAPIISQVVVDEAAQCVEPEAMVPIALARNAEHFILCGDHRQLRPVISCYAAAQAGMDISLFERLACQARTKTTEKSRITLLNQQYRMHPDISCFPCKQFYEGALRDAECTKDLQPAIIAHRNSSKRCTYLVFWDTGSSSKGSDELRQSVRVAGVGSVGSRANPFEAEHSVRIASEIARVAKNASVAILSWYSRQVALVKELLADAGAKHIHAGTIASAQGSEWDFVILTAVRTRSHSDNLGILSDPHVLNVALTRGKCGLIIVCDRQAVERDAHWRELAIDCEKRGLLTNHMPDLLSVGKVEYGTSRVSSSHAAVSLACRARHAETAKDEALMPNPQKVSDMEFSKLMKRSGKLASYGKTSVSHELSHRPDPMQSKTVVAHKGVLYGAPKKKFRAWQAQMHQEPSSPSSGSASPCRSVSRSRSRHR